FSNNMTIGCGFSIKKENLDENDNDNDNDNNVLQYNYITKLYFTYNGVKCELYPNDDSSLLSFTLLHNMFPKISTGSKGCILDFNFGPKFKFESINNVIQSIYDLEKLYNYYYEDQYTDYKWIEIIN